MIQNLQKDSNIFKDSAEFTKDSRHFVESRDFNVIDCPAKTSVKSRNDEAGTPPPLPVIARATPEAIHRVVNFYKNAESFMKSPELSLRTK